MYKTEEVEKLANDLEEILKKSPCVFSYIEGYIDCFLQKKPAQSGKLHKKK